MTSTLLDQALSRNLIFVSGKGGVGKTAVSRAIAEKLARQGKKTLWVALEDPTRPAHELKKVSPHLWELNCEASAAFEEYVGLKLGAPALTRLFLQNKVIRALVKAAPGIHELVLLGKIWHERNNYDHVVTDMLSTGYAVAMFQSCLNFAELFQGGPIHRDAKAMLETFRDAKSSSQVIVALPEEMPLRESLELSEQLLRIMPNNPPAYLVNRLFPPPAKLPDLGEPDQWPSPLPSSAEDYALKRAYLENYNLRIWKDAAIPYGELPFVVPPLKDPFLYVVRALATELEKRGHAS